MSEGSKVGVGYPQHDLQGPPSGHLWGGANPQTSLPIQCPWDLRRLRVPLLTTMNPSPRYYHPPCTPLVQEPHCPREGLMLLPLSLFAIDDKRSSSLAQLLVFMPTCKYDKDNQIMIALSRLKYCFSCLNLTSSGYYHHWLLIVHLPPMGQFAW